MNCKEMNYWKVWRNPEDKKFVLVSLRQYDRSSTSALAAFSLAGKNTKLKLSERWTVLNVNDDKGNPPHSPILGIWGVFLWFLLSCKCWNILYIILSFAHINALKEKCYLFFTTLTRLVSKEEEKFNILFWTSCIPICNK